jgi:hypothetical protein
MESSPHSSGSRVSRRGFLQSTTAASLGAVGVAGGVVQVSVGAGVQVAKAEEAARRNQIVEENAKLGSRDWQLTRVRLDKKDGFRAKDIEGYCSRQSVKAGETLEIFVSSKERFEIEIFRTGYYGGCGARLMQKLGPFEGKEQPVPAKGEHRLHECRWKATASVKIPGDWVSGVYLGRLTTLPTKESEPYWQSYVVFIVTDERKADVLVQCSDQTWQAYNRWPNDYSVYTDPKGTQGPWSHVSFDRPYAKYAQIFENPQSIGSGEWLCFEFPMAYWLEQEGYDVTYCSNSDLLTPDRALRCKAFLSVGHDEYWDIRQYRSVEKLRDSGVSVLFFSGNSVCWVTPLRASVDGRANRIMFRGGPYGGDYQYAVGREKDHGPFPERGPDEGYLMGARNVEPVNGGGDWICRKPGHWMFEGTGMKAGEGIPGLIGWEYHGDPPAIPGLEVVASGTAFQGGTRPQQWTATIYPGPKGNFVFNASTIFWAQGLSQPPGHILPWSHGSRPHGPDARVQQMTRNLLNRAIGNRVG